MSQQLSSFKIIWGTQAYKSYWLCLGVLTSICMNNIVCACMMQTQSGIKETVEGNRGLKH